MKREFLDLGKQPIANGFLKKEQFPEEPFFSLRVGFDEETSLVSLMEFVDKGTLFNENYVYVSSGSETMRKHFEKAAKVIQNSFSPSRILEIGSNDGVFLKNFLPKEAIAVEPCSNFANITRQHGYDTWDAYWDLKTSEEILLKYGPVDIVYSANCISHISDVQKAFEAITNVLALNGVMVLEDPALDSIIENNAFDQMYDEHAYIFSVIALDNLLKKVGLEIFRVEKIKVHGGSNRVYARKMALKSRPSPEFSVYQAFAKEQKMGLDKFSTYQNFAENVRTNRDELVRLLTQLKAAGKKVIGYGATAKSVIITNFCGIGPDLISYISDTTPHKWDTYSPGMHIPVIPAPKQIASDVDFAFLGAWNFQEEIMKNEAAFVARGGEFITHVPTVMMLP